MKYTLDTTVVRTGSTEPIRCPFATSELTLIATTIFTEVQSQFSEVPQFLELLRVSFTYANEPNLRAGLCVKIKLVYREPFSEKPDEQSAEFRFIKSPEDTTFLKDETATLCSSVAQRLLMAIDGTERKLNHVKKSVPELHKIWTSVE